ncbi:CGNR zinc finger domain-containing protein [Kribbella sp. NBC_01505]|uniref:CGNR zinc finger domain-containing protein n=1 Tax=Kribbella sp. NBC_01505 TaxID=2903580 RepID=UPI00386E255B
MTSSSRYDLEAAPGNLGLAQELINTVGIGKHSDLLSDPEAAGTWTTTPLTDADLELLRAFRTDLQRLVSRSEHPTQQWATDLTLGFGPDAAVELTPPPDGASALISRTLAGIYEAQLLDTWRRLKSCRNPDCRAAFYDRSKNNSRVWHSLTTCGNPANLRAHRARARS